MGAITEFDAYLISQGKHWKAYEVLGAHPTVEAGVEGTRFAVWAPDADEVSVLADLNGWRHSRNLLTAQGRSGIWLGFVPGIRSGAPYKFGLRPRGSKLRLEKSDPYAFAAELRPKTASVVAEFGDGNWNDDSWREERRRRDWRSSPVSIYELHLGSWRQNSSRQPPFLTYRELARQIPKYVAGLGFTHVELMPVAEHPLDMSWGYQTTGYFAPTARFGPPADFMYFVDSCHQAGIGVLMDWVPAHFPKDAHGLARFDGSYLYEHADPRKGEHPDWGTLIFNYGRNEVRTFLISNALFWLDKYHIDGLRVDAVASMLYLDYSRGPGQWVPNHYGGRENLEAVEFLRELNGAVHEAYPDALMIAEESTAWPNVTGSLESGGLGFDLKWNMGWMHDTLEYFGHDPVHRRFHQGQLTFSLMYAFSERFLLPISHDEVTHGKGSLLNRMPGDAWQKFANVRLFLAYMFGHPGKKLLFMGIEFGQWDEWDFNHSLDWHLVDSEHPDHSLHRGLRRLLKELNAIYRAHRALHEVDFDDAGFAWIDFADSDNSIVVFERKGRAVSEGSGLIFICNLTPVVRSGYRIGLPASGSYREILNTDAKKFGGSGVLNSRAVTAEEVPYRGQPFSAEFTLPPLATIVLSSNPKTMRGNRRM